MGMASCHLRHQRMWRSHTTVLLDSPTGSLIPMAEQDRSRRDRSATESGRGQRGVRNGGSRTLIATSERNAA
jgi:hypothetical protein